MIVHVPLKSLFRLSHCSMKTCSQLLYRTGHSNISRLTVSSTSQPEKDYLVFLSVPHQSSRDLQQLEQSIRWFLIDILARLHTVVSCLIAFVNL